jgi:hypothetical protein
LLLLLLQVKIAELPLDSFRMLQALEWEDQFSSPNPPAQEHPMPLTRSGSGKNLADKVNGLENGAPEQQGEPQLGWCLRRMQGLVRVHYRT